VSATVETFDWTEANKQYLLAALAEVRRLLEVHVARVASANGREAATPHPDERVPAERDATIDPEWPGPGPPPALESVSAAFGLSRFERAILVMCAGVELDGAFASLVARAQGGDALGNGEPTFSLALAALADPHWSAITPGGPLRRWRLVDVAPGPSVTRSPVRIDERVLHHLAGVDQVDERLAGVVHLPHDALTPSPSQRKASDALSAAWMDPARLPVVHLCGPGPAAWRPVAAAGCASLGLSVLALPSASLPPDPVEMGAYSRLCEREAALVGAALLLEHEDGDGETGREGVVDRFTDALGAPLMVGSRDRTRPRHRRTIVIDVRRLTVDEQRMLWRRAVPEVPDAAIDEVVSQFDLDADGILNSAAAARSGAMTVWDACRRQVQPRMDDLAQRIEPVARWDDLVLPAPVLAVLREIGMQARHRATVYERWGFGERGPRGLGITALFAGTSGTGKTMAAEVLAADLALDLYRIDLSRVVSKYIGETEKNLRRVFDAAEQGGAVLLFDEADALFGKRTEVKDSHDRYANIEVSYLLQRMEAYRGLAILTTNMKEALDTAFLRRLRFVVHFPFPDADARSEIWRRIFPAATPVDGLSVERLAQLNIAGGSIRNVAVSAAFLAAEAGSAVGMTQIARAVRSEYAKLGRTLTAAEIGELG
jgi:ATPase family associated with various cellular activities (AAA)